MEAGSHNVVIANRPKELFDQPHCVPLPLRTTFVFGAMCDINRRKILLCLGETCQVHFHIGC